MGSKQTEVINPEVSMHFYFYAVLTFLGQVLPISDTNRSTLSALGGGTIASSDVIVEGSFTLPSSPSGEKVKTIDAFRRTYNGRDFSIPFSVEHAIKGTVSKTVSVKLFYPVSLQGDSKRWLIPFREKLLIFLKKNLKSDTYSFVDPWNSWFVVSDNSGGADSNSDTTSNIMTDINAFLAFYQQHPNIVFKYSLTPEASSTNYFEYLDTDPSLVRALQLGEAIGPNDAAFIDITKKYIDEPGPIGRIAREIQAGAGNCQIELQRLASYNSGKLQGLDRENLPGELYPTIEKAAILNHVMPLVQGGLASSDVQVRYWTVLGLLGRTQNRGEGRVLYPLFVSLLDDPDTRIQTLAMGGIFNLSGEANKPIGNRDINAPSEANFKKNPVLYINQFKDWWNKNKDSLQ